ncbi:MAG: hopanoid biosynthesis-associated protein HpnK [Verrucomicrobiota bacterium]|nr:hopanoid biosynthesis-associated protein HpnK [Verrucomicrobiota bacterium]
MNSVKRLIINADDFGREASINQAIVSAHHEGVLTSASLMVNEEGFEDAVRLARENPQMGVGLHLTLLCGHSVLPFEKIPSLVNSNQEFSNHSAREGMRYFFSAARRQQLRLEIAAQFEKFHTTGLPLDHVNGHLHMHMHPVVINMILENAERWKIRTLRLTNEPFFLNCRMSSGHWCYRITHALIYRVLSGLARSRVKSRKIRHTQRVFGLLQNARVDEAYVLNLLSQLPDGDSELYSHPTMNQPRYEFEAFVSPRVKSRIKELSIQLIRYQDL